jgi:glycosyltransferase involved in cell wall biosynthesis
MTVLVWVSSVTLAGGMERVALSIAKGLASRGIPVVLVGPYSSCPALRNQIQPPLQYCEHRPRRSIAGLIDTTRFLRQVVREYKVDVVSAHGSVFPLLPLSVPVVWTEHGLRYGDGHMLRGPKALLWRLVMQRLQSRQWRFVGVSKFVLDGVRRQLSLDQGVGTIIYNGVPVAARLRALAPPRLVAPYQLGFLGRFESEKRPLDVFELDEQLKGLNVPRQWHIFGAGSLRDAVRQKALANQGMSFHGFSDVETAFAAMDLLFFSSHGEREGLPTVLLEAQLARRLAAAWDVTCIPEAAGEHATLVSPPFHISRMAEAIAATLRARRVPPAPRPGYAEVDAMLSEYEVVLTEATKPMYAGATA